MESKWIVGRSQLRRLHRHHPDWNKKKLAQELGYSLTWVKKWLKRFAAADPDDETVLFSQSRAPGQHQKQVTEEVERKILEIRDHPPENLARVPGPVAILYYLHRDEELKKSGAYLPRSTSTIRSILDRNQRIYRYRRPRPEPEERPEPLSHVQIDFKSVSSVPADPDGKQQHVVETLNMVDKGTSILLTATPRDDYNAETVITTMVDSFMVNGLPEVVTFDRDPRFIGSWTAREFPSPFMRFLMCLGIRVNVCPPQRPDRNAFVERYHLSYDRDCLIIHRPNNLAKTVACTAAYQHHYNWERPNQAITCGNRPPRIAFPNLPKRPGLPTTVDPDSWLDQLHGRFYQSIVLKVDAQEKHLVAFQDNKPVKQVPLKGLYNGIMLFEDYLPLVQAEAVSDYRRYLHRRYYH
jgi:hypothetical protein